MGYINDVMGKNSVAPPRMRRVHFCTEQLVPEGLAIRLELDRLKPPGNVWKFIYKLYLSAANSRM